MSYLKRIFILTVLIACHFLTFSQDTSEKAPDKINEKSVRGIYHLHDTINDVNVTLEIKRKNQFKNVNLHDNTVTTFTGNWSIDRDTLVLEVLTYVQEPAPEGDVFSQKEMKLVQRNRDLYAVVVDGGPAGNIRLKRK